ncbi:MAG: HlyD family efflux transporter periplasmic adaptor subunit [Anaerolineales bacterium]
MMKKLHTSLIVLLTLSALLLSACGSPAPTPAPAPASDIPSGVIAEGRLLPRQSLPLSFGARGKVSEILVKEGDTVQAGDVLARLAESAQAEASLSAAMLELTSAQQAYDALLRTADLTRAQAWKAYLDAQAARAAAQRAWEALDEDKLERDIDDAAAEVKDKKEALDDAQDTFDKYKDLNKDNATRKAAEDDLKKAQDAYNEAVRTLEAVRRTGDSLRAALDAALAAEAEAKHAYELTANGPDADKLALAEARLQAAKAQHAAAELALENFIIRAPFDGTVADLNVEVGELAGPEKYAVMLANFSAWKAETTDLTELDVVNVAEGQKVTLVADALPGETMSGVVESISQVFRVQSGDILYTVTIAVDDVPPAARWGMTVEVTFEP